MVGERIVSSRDHVWLEYYNGEYVGMEMNDLIVLEYPPTIDSVILKSYGVHLVHDKHDERIKHHPNVLMRKKMMMMSI